MICAVIATRHHPPELARLLGVLASDSVCTHLIVDAPGTEHRLNRMWNDACDAAVAHGASSIAVLEDDVAILPGTLPLFAQALANNPWLGAVHPDGTTPDWILPTGPIHLDGNRQLTGACFMLRSETGVRFDETLPFGYGEQQFDQDLRAAGWTIGCALGVPYRQAPESSTRQARDRLRPVVREGERRSLALGSANG